MLKKPLPGPARLMLGAGLAVLASSAGAAALWQQQPATVVSLPAISLAAAVAPLPTLAVEGRLPPPTALLSVASVAAVAPVATATSVAPAAPAGSSPANAAVAPVAAPARAVATPAPEAPPSAETTPAVAPKAGKAGAASQRAPLAPPLRPEQNYAYSENQPLPPPPMPQGEVEVQVSEPRVLVIAAASPGAGDVGYQPPRIRLAKPARLPVLASTRPETLVAYGMVMKVDLDARGKPVHAEVYDSKLGDVYARNALAAVKRWRFEPALSEGRAREATVLVPVWFEGTTDVGSLESEAFRHPRPQYRAPPQMVAGQ